MGAVLSGLYALCGGRRGRTNINYSRWAATESRVARWDKPRGAGMNNDAAPGSNAAPG